VLKREHSVGLFQRKSITRIGAGLDYLAARNS
jgi:hypothetical protein